MRRRRIQLKSAGCSLVLILAFAAAWWAWIYQSLWIYSNSNHMPMGLNFLWGGLAVFFLAAQAFPAVWRVRIAMAAGSSLVSLCLLEIALGLPMFQETEPQDRTPEPWRDAMRKAAFDARTQHQVVFQLRATGKDAWPVYYPGQIAQPLYPLSGLSGVTTVYGNESGQYFIYESDEHGFNNPRGGHADSGTDLVLIGDSFTHGCCPEAGRDVGSRLRDRGWRALNLGMAGHGPLEELGTLLEYGKRKRPAAVLWLYYEENDLDDLRLEERSAILGDYLYPGFTQDLIKREEEKDAVVREWLAERLGIPDSAHAVDSPKAAPPAVISEEIRPPQAPDGNWGDPFWFRLITLNALTREIQKRMVQKAPPINPLFKRVLKRAQSVVSEWGGEIRFVYLPSWHRYHFDEAENDSYYQRDQVLRAVRELGIPIIDFQQSMNRFPQPKGLFPFGKHGHYTAEGYQLLSDRIDQALRAGGAMPLNSGP